MKNFFYLLFTAIIIGACNPSSGGGKALNDLNAANLKGNVLQVKESYHKVGSTCCPGGDKNECSQKVTAYNEKGYTIEKLQIGVHGDTIQKSSYKYNNIPVCTSVENSKGGHLISIENNKIKENLVQEVAVTDAKGMILNTHLFDYQKGMLTYGETMDNEGKLLSSFTNEYQNGSVKTEIVKDSQGEIFSMTRNYRNDHGDIVKSIVTHPRDKSEFTVNFEYVYDKEGNWVKQTKIYNDDIISIRIREIEYRE